MKKTSLVSILSFIFLILSSIVAYFLKHLSFPTLWASLFIGVGILIISGVLAIFAKKNFRLNLVCFLLSSVALGFCIRTWYNFRNFDNSLLTIILVSLATIVYLWVFYGFLYIPLINKHYRIFMMFFLIASLALYIYVIATTQTTYVSTFGFYMIIELAFIFAISQRASTLSELFRHIVISTYSVFIVAIIIGIMILGQDNIDLDLSHLGLDLQVTSPKDERLSK